MGRESYDELEKKLRSIENPNPAEEYLLELLEIKNKIDAIRFSELTNITKHNPLVSSIDSLITDFIYNHGLIKETLEEHIIRTKESNEI